MPSKLTFKERLTLVQRALQGENISLLCQEAGISRTLLYRWIKRYKGRDQTKGELTALKPQIRKSPAVRSVSEDNILQILKIIWSHPEYSVAEIVANLPKQENGKPLVGQHGVQNILERLNLNTVEKRLRFQKQAPPAGGQAKIIQYPQGVYSQGVYSPGTPEESTIGHFSKEADMLESPTAKFSPHERLIMIERVKAGGPVAELCRKFGVSRTIFYRWLKRYEQAPEGQKLEALWDKKPKVEKYYNQASEEYEQAVLAAVGEYPELSSHKLVWVLPQVGGRPILGNHGVQNILHRHNLETYEQRRAYAELYRRASVVQRFFEPIMQVLNLVLSKKPAARSFIVRGSVIFGFAAFSVVAVYGIGSLIFGGQSLVVSIGMMFSLTSLFFGMLFFLYSLKYYITIAVVLSFSRHAPSEAMQKEGVGQGIASIFSKLFGHSPNESFSSDLSVGSTSLRQAGGLQPDLSDVTLSRTPFVSIHLATYNEKRVVDRLLTAATSMEYENYEVVMVDDSNDETLDILKRWENHPRVKIIHRASREGFKGGALREALRVCDSRTEFVLVFDADFIPYPDTITQFLKYFQSLCGSLDFRHTNGSESLVRMDPNKKENTFGFIRSNHSGIHSYIAAIQGYQWHVLNKSENWVTRGVRSEYAGSYVIERSGTEIYQGLKQIAGSVYMIRRDVLSSIGWETSITEDFQLTLKLYEQGYKVVYTPYIQAPAEAVSTIKRLVRQRMRWAEGHSHNIKRMFTRLLFGRWEESASRNQRSAFSYNPQLDADPLDARRSKVWLPSPLSFSEKLEFLYLSPYYLQAFFFILGTFSWFIAEVVFQVRLPFWTEVWGWSLVFTNLFALPLMNMVGLFLEEAEERDYLGLFSFIALSYIVAPFQAYAAIKGLLASQEGPWFRTPKTGRITDIFTPGRFYRYVFGIFGRPQVAPSASIQMYPNDFRIHANNSDQFGLIIRKNSYVALATAHNRFNEFKIQKIKRLSWVSKAALSILLIVTTGLLYLSHDVKLVYATNWASPLKLEPGNSGDASFPTFGNYLSNSTSYSAGAVLFLRNTNSHPGTNNYTWFSNYWPSGGGSATIPPGNYYLQIAKSSNGTTVTNRINMMMQLLLTSQNGTGQAIIAENQSYGLWPNNTDNTTLQYFIQNIVGNNIVSTAQNRLALRLQVINGSANANSWVNILINNSGNNVSALFLPATITVPEVSKVTIMLIILVILPTIPALMSGRYRKEGRSIIQEFKLAWLDFIRKLTGMGEEELDRLPV